MYEWPGIMTSLSDPRSRWGGSNGLVFAVGGQGESDPVVDPVALGGGGDGEAGGGARLTCCLCRWCPGGNCAEGGLPLTTGEASLLLRIVAAQKSRAP